MWIYWLCMLPISQMPTYYYLLHNSCLQAFAKLFALNHSQNNKRFIEKYAHNLRVW